MSDWTEERRKEWEAKEAEVKDWLLRNKQKDPSLAITAVRADLFLSAATRLAELETALKDLVDASPEDCNCAACENASAALEGRGR